MSLPALVAVIDRFSALTVSADFVTITRSLCSRTLALVDAEGTLGLTRLWGIVVITTNRAVCPACFIGKGSVCASETARLAHQCVVSTNGAACAPARHAHARVVLSVF